MDNKDQWQAQFVKNYLNDLPGSALLTAKPGQGKTHASLKIWEGLVSRHEFENLFIVTSNITLKEHWKDMINKLWSKPPGKSFIIENVQKLYHNVSSKNDFEAAFKSHKSFVIIDEAHRYSSGIMLPQFLLRKPSAQSDNSKVLFLAPFDVEEYRALFQGEALVSEYIYDPEVLKQQQTIIEVSRFSPSYDILQKLLLQKTQVDDLSWREFEKLVAQLLENDGYEIELMNGTKDGGVDVIAYKKDEVSGLYKTVWQAKKYTKNKVGLSAIRELADSVRELKATKGVIVTNTFLTAGAHQRIIRDKYTLGKVERNDLEAWIMRTLYGR